MSAELKPQEQQKDVFVPAATSESKERATKEPRIHKLTLASLLLCLVLIASSVWQAVMSYNIYKTTCSADEAIGSRHLTSVAFFAPEGLILSRNGSNLRLQ